MFRITPSLGAMVAALAAPAADKPLVQQRDPISHMPPIFRRRNQTGPGRKTVDHYASRTKYSGADLRRIRAERGCGRPPR